MWQEDGQIWTQAVTWGKSLTSVSLCVFLGKNEAHPWRAWSQEGLVTREGLARRTPLLAGRWEGRWGGSRGWESALPRCYLLGTGD